MKTIVTFLFALFLGLSSFAGNNDKVKATVKNISGKITDASGNEIPAAQITVKETNETFFADENGNFNFKVKTDKTYTISVNSIGYAPVEVNSSRLGNFSEINLSEL